MKYGYSSWDRRVYAIPETVAERMIAMERLDKSTNFLRFCMWGRFSYAQYVRDTIMEMEYFPDDFGELEIPVECNIPTEERL